MSHPFHRYIATKLEELLKKRRIVVFYDSRREFEPFIDELAEVGKGHDDLPRVFVGDTMTWLVQYEGSFFALRHAVEPVAGADFPEPLLVYLPGVERDRKTSVLMEMEKAGQRHEPQLRRLALNELRKKYSDGQIDEMLASDSLTYQDIVRYLEQQGDAGGSLVKLVLGEGDSEKLLTRWLADESFDEKLEDKGATEELYRLVQARLGLEVANDAPLGKARRLVNRYVLINEFRSDLTCGAPDSLGLVQSPATEDFLRRLRDLANRLRTDAADAYPGLADEVETEFKLAQLGIPATGLGSIDTFRFEERTLLQHAATMIGDGHHEEALSLVSGRGKSFWVDHDIARRAQWEVCKLSAELSQQVELVRESMAGIGKKGRAWLEAYSGADGWHAADRAQRLLETWYAQMDDDPEPALEKAIAAVRLRYEEVLGKMAKQFSAVLAESGFTIPGVLHQTRVFSQEVAPRQGRVAYFLTDALRFEMATDLVEQLAGARDVRVQPGLAALPTITAVGMAALMPGASSGFSVVEHQGKLVAQIGDALLSSVSDRVKHMKANVPDSEDIDIGTLLQKSVRSVEKKIGGANLLVVRSQSIDGLGEMDGGLLARQVMATAVGNLSRAVRKLVKLGFEHFVITADHGYQFSSRKEGDMIIDKPGGETVDLHRRCWAGRGGQTSGGCVRATGPELGYQSNLDFVFQQGLGVFPAGGSLTYHHGGISLQELVVPVVTFRMDVVTKEAPAGPTVTIEGVPAVLANRTFGLTLRLGADLFATGQVPIRLVLVADGQEVGRAGMALDAEFDRTTATVMAQPGKSASVAMMLTNEEFSKVRVVAQDPTTDAVLAQSNDIEVKLGI